MSVDFTWCTTDRWLSNNRKYMARIVDERGDEIELVRWRLIGTNSDPTPHQGLCRWTMKVSVFVRSGWYRKERGA